MRIPLSIILLVSLIATAAAQFDMDFTKMASRPVMALMRDDIKKELKLNKEQNAEIGKIVKEVNGLNRGSGNPMAVLDKMKEADQKILAVLDEPQKKRLSEIRIQIQGPPALSDPEVAGPLQLSEDQVNKVKEMQSSYMSEMMSLMQKGMDRSTQGKLDKLRDDRDKKMLELLSAEQQAKFKEMQGPVFKNARPKGIF